MSSRVTYVWVFGRVKDFKGIDITKVSLPTGKVYNDKLDKVVLISDVNKFRVKKTDRDKQFHYTSSTDQYFYASVKESVAVFINDFSMLYLETFLAARYCPVYHFETGKP